MLPAGPPAVSEAEKARTRLVHEVDQRRSPRTLATVNQLHDRHLETLNAPPTTRSRYEDIIRNQLQPASGRCRLGKLDGDILDRFFGQLRRRRERCNGRARHVKHQTQREHECDEQSVLVVPCRPLSVSSVPQTHRVLNAAFQGAMRWRWLIHVRTGLKLADRNLVRRDTKTHQQQRIALDDQTVVVPPSTWPA